jgi:hypothetical protein
MLIFLVSLMRLAWFHAVYRVETLFEALDMLLFKKYNTLQQTQDNWTLSSPSRNTRTTRYQFSKLLNTVWIRALHHDKFISKIDKIEITMQTIRHMKSGWRRKRFSFIRRKNWQSLRERGSCQLPNVWTNIHSICKLTFCIFLGYQSTSVVKKPKLITLKKKMANITTYEWTSNYVCEERETTINMHKLWINIYSSITIPRKTIKEL